MGEVTGGGPTWRVQTRADIIADIGEYGLRRRLRERSLVRVLPGHYVDAGTFARVPDIRFKASAHVILRRWPDAVLSHRPAAYIHGFKALGPTMVEVIVPPGAGRPRANCRCRIRRTPHRVDVNGWRITDDAATLIALIAVWGVEAVERVVDKHYPTPLSRRGVLDRARGRGTRGAALVRMLEHAPDGTESKLEARVLRALRRAGATVAPNSRIGSYRWDLVIDVGGGRMLIIEIDSDVHHRRGRGFLLDRPRQNQLMRRGHFILRYTEADFSLRFDAMIGEILATARELSGEGRAESAWDRGPAWELYDALQLELDARVPEAQPDFRP